MLYRYIYYSNGGIVLQSGNIITQVELNRITRFLFGEGAAANSVFNCGVGAFIKFQSQPHINKKRAFLTTKVWRYCKQYKIKISHSNFPRKKNDGISDGDFNSFLSHINKNATIQ